MRPTNAKSYVRSLIALLVSAQPISVAAQADGLSPAEGTYADVAALSEMAGLVARIQITKLARLEPARVTGVRQGYGRFYVEGETQALLTGTRPLGEFVKYLVDLPLDDNGRQPDLKRREVFIFARRVPAHPEELQLVTPTAQFPWSAAGAARLRTLLRALVSRRAPPKVTGVRELIHVPGNLAGQGRTQIFLNTQNDSSASIAVIHEPGKSPVWGVSFSEVAANGRNPVQRNSLQWFRLACFLPDNPPPGSNHSKTKIARRKALADYHLVLSKLRPCDRTERSLVPAAQGAGAI